MREKLSERQKRIRKKWRETHGKSTRWMFAETARFMLPASAIKKLSTYELEVAGKKIHENIDERRKDAAVFGAAFARQHMSPGQN